MLALVSLFVVIIVSLLVTHIAAIALSLTGLSHQAARFQARSAFTGVGFTTQEAEKVVNHPLRRRIVTTLMLLGNAGVVTAISSLVLTFVNVNQTRVFIIRLFLLGAGLMALWRIATSQWVDRYLSNLISRALRHWQHLDVRDYSNLLHLTGEYSVVELRVNADDWVADKTLAQLDLQDEGIIVLGIYRENGNYVGAPGGQSEVKPGDTLLLYGREPLLDELDVRADDPSGEQAHRDAVVEQQRVLQTQAQQEAKDVQKERG